MRAKVAAAWRLLFMMACLAIVTLPAINMVKPIVEQAPLRGVVPDAPCPGASLSALFSEKLQRGVTECFEQRYGVRPTATRLHNSISYWVFGETHPDKLVRVGTNDVLYMQVQVDFHNRHDTPKAVQMAAKIKRMQDLLRAQGKVFILMILPTKMLVYPDDLPRTWIRDGASPQVPEARITQPFVDALRGAGALFVDGRESVASLPREAIYTKTGRHLAAPAACRILSDALRVARPLIAGATVPEIDCDYRLEHGVSIEEEDFDLLRLLNIWGRGPTDVAPVMRPAAERAPITSRADAAVVGTSFGWRMIFEAERTHALRHQYYYYYDSLLVDRGGGSGTVTPKSREWKEFIAASTLFLYPTPEEFLIEDGEAFFDSVISVYGDARSQ